MTTTGPVESAGPGGRDDAAAVRVELLHAPGCPNVRATRQVALDCLHDLGLDMPIVERVGRYRSPAVLINGVDVMSGETGDDLVGDACRVDLPTREHVLAAIQPLLPSATTSPTGAEEPALITTPLTVDSLCDAARDGIAARAAALPEPVRELHRRVLRVFLSTGRAPDQDQLRNDADGLGMTLADGLGRLAKVDLLHSGQNGRILVAYPFSARRTGHTVQLPDTPAMHAMCAIDALGIPLMADQDAIITSADPTTGKAIRVDRHDQLWHWEPATAVVVLAQTGHRGRAAECLCPSITFHIDRDHAQHHLTHHPELHGAVLNHQDAIEVARLSFGTLLTG